jgi:phosphatidylinositol alpha-mannosyltransferase
LRVAQVCPYSLSVPGGVQGQVVGLASALERAGHSVTVIAPTDDARPGVTSVGPSRPVSANGSVAPLALSLAAAARTLDALGDKPFDVVHLHEPFAPGVCLTALLGAEAPLVGTFHRSGRSPAYAALGPVLSRFARRLSVRCAVSSAAESTAADAVGGSYQVCFNAVEVEAYATAEPWPVDPGAATILFIGRHETRKGLAVLLEAIEHLDIAVQVWVAGDGPDSPRLRQLSASDGRIEWLGRISEAEKMARLRAASVLCAPSLGGESFGVVLLEAMAAGTPLVATSIEGYLTVATHQLDALLVPPGDAAALAQAIGRILEEPGLGAGVAAAGRQRAASLSMDALAQWYIGVYDEALSRRAG